MNKKCKQMMGAVLLMASFSQSGSALATSCAVPPTCEQLGYKMKVDDCGENPVLRCPFALSDDNQVYCTESGWERRCHFVWGRNGRERSGNGQNADWYRV